METGHHIVVLHERDSERLGHMPGARIRIKSGNTEWVMVANTSRHLVNPGELGTFLEATETIGLPSGSEVEVSLAPQPVSISAIKKKLRGEVLSAEEIRTIISDMVSNNLTTAELAAFVAAQYTRGMSMEEIVALTRYMVETGEKLEFDTKPILDVHSIGGVPGNKYALLTVPIASAAGLRVPKTSSRAITSAAGTADVMEVLAPVALSLSEIKRIVEQVGAVLAWGGSVRLAPADDIIIQVERQLGIDPRCQLLASVMSKKLAVGADCVVIDIPAGPGAKVHTREEARELAHDFIELARRLGIQMEVAVTYGGQPVGYAIGPALEAREALETLQGNGPGSLVEKATSLAGLMLELGGIASPGLGKQMAVEILKSGRALEQLRKIIEAQGGDPDIDPHDLPIGQYTYVIEAPVSGYVKRVYNERINAIARAAGAPFDKGAGVRILLKEGRKVERGEPLAEIYAEHENKLDEAIALANQHFPVLIEGMLLEKLSHRPRVE
jgi:AMP phosphorylase